MEMHDCPRFERCSAPVCPLDRNWRKVRHFDGDAVCRWMLELAKEGGETEIKRALVAEVAERVIAVYPIILDATPAIARRVQRAALSPSRRRLGRERLQGAL